MADSKRLSVVITPTIADDLEYLKNLQGWTITSTITKAIHHLREEIEIMENGGDVRIRRPSEDGLVRIIFM